MIWQVVWAGFGYFQREVAPPAPDRTPRGSTAGRPASGTRPNWPWQPEVPHHGVLFAVIVAARPALGPKPIPLAAAACLACPALRVIPRSYAELAALRMWTVSGAVKLGRQAAVRPGAARGGRRRCG